MWSATHALDIGFVFDNVAKSASMSGVGERQQALDRVSDAIQDKFGKRAIRRGGSMRQGQ